MKVWIYINGRQEGPYALEDLLDKAVDENTKVWYEGLPKWYPAGTLEAMQPLFDGTLAARMSAEDTNRAQAGESDSDIASPTAGETVIEETVIVNDEPKAVYSRPQSRFAPGQRCYHRETRPDAPCPPTHLGWNIFLTICCCSPVSIAGLVASICVTSYYNSGKLGKARKASEVAAWLVMAGIALGMFPLIFMAALLGD